MAEEREIQQPIKIEFDAAHNPETPTLVLAKRNGEKIGEIIAKDVVLTDFFNDASQIQFNVYKYIDGRLDGIWESIDNFKLIWCRNWDVWFEIAVEISETNDTQKMVTCTQLGQAELSQKIIDGIEINTETDIARADYDPEHPTVFWNPDRPASSLLHRMMDDVPHYTVEYVDPTLCNIQRTFTFDNISLYDAFQEVAEEIGCVFVFPSDSVDGKPNRTIRVYDLEANCKDCDYRGEFTGECPECGSSNINEGYGFDTTIFITADDLGEDLQFTTDTGAVKNVFKLVAGDDVMTATVQGCNPTGSNRIWYIPSYMREDMTKELQAKLAAYDSDYEYYRSDYDPIADGKISGDAIDKYNSLVEKYHSDTYYHGEDLQEIVKSELKGYTKLMEAMYATIDTELFLQSVMMPNMEYDYMYKVNLTDQLDALLAMSGETVAISSIGRGTSDATATSAVLAMAKVVVNPNFQVKAYCNDDGWVLSEKNSVWSGVWTGYFVVTDYSNSETTGNTFKYFKKYISINVVDGSYDDNYQKYLDNLIDKALYSDDNNDLSIVGLFNLPMNSEKKSSDTISFEEALQLYCLDELTIFNDACRSVLEVMQEMGVPDGGSWGDVYNEIYVPYLNKQEAIESEMDTRQQEIYIVTGYLDNNQDRVYGTQTYLNDAITYIQDVLNMANYMGDDLWKELCAYRREDIYTNSNYISDGLDNAQIFSNALQFIKVASDELYKSAERQHSISSTLHDLLTIKKFEPIVDYFAVGNWLRLRIDGNIYKLRLISYSIDYNDLKLITVDFSDVMQVATGLTDLQSVVQQAASMGTSYSYTQHQATNGDSAKSTIAGWSLNGLDVTNTKIIQSAEGQDQTWDEHGMLFRKYDPITDTYADEQLKIVNGTMAITTDNWKTISTAVGRFYYQDPHDSSHMIEAYGVNGQVLVGQLLLGEALGIYAEDENGKTTLEVSSDGVYLSTSNMLIIDSGNLQIDKDGNVSLTGKITAESGDIGGWEISSFMLSKNSEAEDGKTQYTVQMQAPNKPSANSVAFYVGSRTYSASSSTTFDPAWYVRYDGYMYANNVNIQGTVRASSGKIGGWQIGDESIYNGLALVNGTDNGTYIGIDGIRQYNNGIYINLIDGTLEANSVNLIGTLTTDNEENKTVLSSGCLTFYHKNDGEANYQNIGSFLANNWIEHDDLRGINLVGENGGSSGELSFIGFGRNENSGSYELVYYISYNDNISEFRHNFSGNVNINGSLYIWDDIYASSDENVKTDINDLPSEFISVLNNLHPKEFRYKDNEGKKHIGFTVQDLESSMEGAKLDPEEYSITEWKVDPDAKEATGRLSYTELIAMLVAGYQDLKSENEFLKSENEELKSKFDELEKRLEKLESNFA